MEDKEKFEFSERDKIANLVSEKLSNKLIERCSIRSDAKEISILEEQCQDWVQKQFEAIATISYRAADAMRKARLGAFK